MNLTLTQLEPLIPAVGLDVVPLLGVDRHPLYGETVAAILALADRLDAQAPLPALAQPHTAFHAWGQTPGKPLPADTLRVFVGPVTGPQLGLGAVGGWQAEQPLSRSWGGWVGLNFDLIQMNKVDAASVGRHEFGHTLGLPHSDDPTSLMQDSIPPGVSRNLTATDADALKSLGWDAKPVNPFPGSVRVWGVGVQSDDTPGPDGWAYVPLGLIDVSYPNHTRQPDPLGDSWALFPGAVSR